MIVITDKEVYSDSNKLVHRIGTQAYFKRCTKLVDENGGEILALGTICMYTHDSTGRKAILTGWLASQSDILGEDWEIL